MDSLYDRLGGAKGLDGIVAVLCAELQAEETLAPFFSDVDGERFCPRLRVFLGHLFGGPEGDPGVDLRRVHARAVAHGLGWAQFDGWMALWARTLRKRGVEEDIIARIAVALEALRRPVQGLGP